MRPLLIQTAFVTRVDPHEIAEAILDLSRWPEFEGWGPIPGIRSAEFEHWEDRVVGSRIRVMNRDGSAHVEQITVWDPPRRLELTLSSFPAPLRWLATRFVEGWSFQPAGDEWSVSRWMRIEPRHAPARWLLRPIAFMLRRAMIRHVAPLADDRRD